MLFKESKGKWCNYSLIFFFLVLGIHCELFCVWVLIMNNNAYLSKLNFYEVLIY